MQRFFTLLGVWFAVALLVGVISYVQYWLDKRNAEKSKPRTPESRLLIVDLLGGWPGGLLAQRTYRHKTGKASYQLRFWGVAMLNVVVWGVIVWLVMR